MASGVSSVNGMFNSARTDFSLVHVIVISSSLAVGSQSHKCKRSHYTLPPPEYATTDNYVMMQPSERKPATPPSMEEEEEEESQGLYMPINKETLEGMQTSLVVHWQKPQSLYMAIYRYTLERMQTMLGPVPIGTWGWW